MGAMNEPAKRPLLGLLIAQFFGAFNDNAWKMVVITLGLRSIGFMPAGAEHDAASQTQAMFALCTLTIPLMLFSLPAGVLADKLSKRNLIVYMKGLEIVLELEPFNEALLKDVHELVRFVKEIDHPAVRANADISHLHLSDCAFDEVAEMKGLIGHIHLSDCDGKVHGDMPAGMGVTPIKEYLAAIRDTGYDGTVSIELEYAPNPDEIVAWAQKAYDGTAAIMRELGVRA